MKQIRDQISTQTSSRTNLCRLNNTPCQSQLFILTTITAVGSSLSDFHIHTLTCVCVWRGRASACSEHRVCEAAGWRQEGDGVKRRKLHLYARCPLFVRGGGRGGAAHREEAAEPRVTSSMFHRTERRLVHVHTRAASHATSPLLVNTALLLSERCRGPDPTSSSDPKVDCMSWSEGRRRGRRGWARSTVDQVSLTGREEPTVSSPPLWKVVNQQPPSPTVLPVVPVQLQGLFTTHTDAKNTSNSFSRWSYDEKYN